MLPDTSPTVRSRRRQRGPRYVARRTWVAWSSGKDSALALARVHGDPDLEVGGLLTTFDVASGNVPLHAIGLDLVRAQAEALRLPLHEVPLPTDSEELQAAALARALDLATKAGVDAVVFGDVHLGWIRERRERAMAGTGIDALFPLWGVPPAELALETVERGIHALIACVDAQAMSASWLGRRYEDFLNALPDSVDPCGENGEFHTFVAAHPGFDAPLDVRLGRVREHERYPSVELHLRHAHPETDREQLKSSDGP